MTYDDLFVFIQIFVRILLVCVYAAIHGRLEDLARGVLGHERRSVFGLTIVFYFFRKHILGL